ncbi:hypothetical protein [Acrocarpospora catenulata]|uniref:hypothetical protein n=1 Tax=Acrocarpospora catenulata TaxID=2836182 RepID=UPI001BDB2B18|nr:hypothetical protein [Acrocarpospora catenulata]
MTGSGEDLLRKALSESIRAMAATGPLTVAEVAADGIARFQLSLDGAGTPRCWVQPIQSWHELIGERWGEPAGPDDQEAVRDAVLRAAGVLTDGTVILISSFSPTVNTDQAMAILRTARPDALALTVPGARVDELISETMAEEPITRLYDLVVLKTKPDTGRLELTGHQLFPSGAKRGERTPVSFQVATTDRRGVAFAVVAWQGRHPQLVSVHRVRLPPGRHEATAELRAPGLVRFHGLPGLVADERDWADLVASIPESLQEAPAAVHLICAIEICGHSDQVRTRIDQAGQMVDKVAASLPGRLKVSLVTYAAHSYDFQVKEEGVLIPAWKVAPGQAREELVGLDRAGPAPWGYPDGAQLEDMLAAVLARLGPERDEDTVLLIIGGRNPHPPAASSHILPCPNQHDWEQLVRRFERRRGARLGVIHDRPPEQAGREWTRLGRAAMAHLDFVDFPALRAGLGLSARDQAVNFPLID